MDNLKDNIAIATLVIGIVIVLILGYFETLEMIPVPIYAAFLIALAIISSIIFWMRRKKSPSRSTG